MKLSIFSPPSKTKGFSLIELMVSVAVLSLLLVIVFQMLEQMQKTWKRTRQTVSEFKDARNGFEEMSRRLGQATTNAYYGYEYSRAPLGGQNVMYGREIVRQSELHFVSGPASILFKSNTNSAAGPRPSHAVFFQAPFGFCYDRSKRDKDRLEFEQLNNLLNAWGYYVEFNTDEADRPNFLNTLRNAPKPRPRYRLMEFRQPTEYLQIYKMKLRNATRPQQATVYEWFTKDDFSVNSKYNFMLGENQSKDETFFRTTRAVAENIVGMIIFPRPASLSESKEDDKEIAKMAPDYLYDTRRFQWKPGNDVPTVTSRHVLPPIIDVTFIAVDEASFNVYAERTGIVNTEVDPQLIPPDLFTKASEYNKDLEALELRLSALKLEYRVFTTSIRLRGSRWNN